MILSSTQARLDAAALACSQSGTQLTTLRRTVLELILRAQGPLTAYQLLDLLKKDHKAAVPPTIYRSLEFLMEHHLIHKIERLSAFVPCVEAGHHNHSVQFLICRDCGKVAELEDPAVSQAVKQAAARQGFQPAKAVIEIEGLCGDCAVAGATSDQT